MILIGGIPAHPLIIHCVVVLLPLAALGAIVIAVRPAWRRSLGVPLALITLVAVAAVPVAVLTGEQLQTALNGGGPLVLEHARRAHMLLPYAVAFGVLVLVTVGAGWRADRTTEPGNGGLVWRRTTTIAGVLAAVLGVVVAGLVVWIGDAGATAVWQGVVR
ncbi:DUF2231 domain-containing protein [Pseudonocardia acidicola]|uniref:DUF2231 domain-containing protein n=1 Tax=Pseudonocardia acidicola TaxID=2724939 RepID=A0ABX1SGC8_9PSEU|nr:DUF2231 domain-containing protein [Pseudonocardia acidicola]NMH99612.1 hypothetical protein [Pseudonocardia acidicola]